MSKKMGRGTKYNPEILKEICQYVQIGMKFVDAANCAGIDESTFYDWKNKHSEFSEALNDAVMKGKASNLAIINRAKNKDWKAAGWLLERRHTDEFGSRQKVNLTGADGKAIELTQTVKMDLSGIDLDTLKALAKINKT
jgi:hypothetical protein